MASMTKREVIKKEVEFNINSKEDIEKEIKHLKDVSKKAYGMSKIQYEQIIIKKEEELLNCIEWLNSTEAIKLKIQSLEKTIESRKLVIQQKHPMTTIQDIREMNIVLDKYEEELKIYIDKLKKVDSQDISKNDREKLNELPIIDEPMVKEQKQPKVAKVKEPKLPKQVKVKEVKVKEDKPKKKAIPSTIKKLVWNTNIGEDIGKAKCVCCKSTDITQISFNCGHVISEHNGGETKVSNLKPICQNCNSSMGTKNMNDFILTLL